MMFMKMLLMMSLAPTTYRACSGKDGETCRWVLASAVQCKELLTINHQDTDPGAAYTD